MSIIQTYIFKVTFVAEFSKTVNLIKIYDAFREPFAQSFVVVSGWGAIRVSSIICIIRYLPRNLFKIESLFQYLPTSSYPVGI